jgi:hypothetical protein
MGCSGGQRELGIFECHLVLCDLRREGAKVRSEQELEFDRWRIAVDIVKRIREAGISCELFDSVQDRH